MKDDVHDMDDPVPSYEESARSTRNITSDTKTPGPPLHTQLAMVWTYRIDSLLDDYLEPLLSTQILNGAAKSTFILIPSDTLTNHPNLATKDLTGLPDSARNAIVVRLHGPDNNAGVWLQDDLVQQLSLVLKRRYNPLEKQQLTESQIPAIPATATWFSQLRKKLGFSQQDHQTASTSHQKLGWRSEDEEGVANRKLAVGEIRINAKVKEVSVMTESELGLLLTETEEGVWLEIEVVTRA